MAGNRSSYSSDRVRAAVIATYAAFFFTGFAFANWASRIPQVRDHLGLDSSELGLVLLGFAIGSLVALPLSGPIINKLGTNVVVTAMALLLSSAFVVIALGYLVGVPILMAGLIVTGFAMGAWDVGMNVQGALVERHLGRDIMSRFHAGFSGGTVFGALTGTLAVFVGLPVTAHLIVVAGIVAISVPLFVRSYLPDVHEEEAHHDGEPRHPLAAWKHPRTLLVGLFVLAFAFGEGSANDWISVAIIDGYHVPDYLGTLCFATFLAAMSVFRWFGPDLLVRYGRVAVLRTLALVGAAGVALFVFGGATPVAFVGAVLWGAGMSLGFPVGMSAGADEPKHAASNVSVIASIGYCAFLGGPPLIGFLGHRFTVLTALTSVAVMMIFATLLSTSVRPPAGSAANLDPSSAAS